MAVENTTEDDTETPAAGGETEVNTPSLLDAISSALEPTLPEQPVADDKQDKSDEDGETDDAELETDDETDEDGTTVDANGRKHGPDGKLLPSDDKSKTGEGTGKAGEQKLGPDGKPLVEDKSKKADPVNDPIPDEVKGRTRERMQSLITAVKEKDEMIGVQNQLFDSIKSTGATPEEFGAMLGYMRWVHSEKPEDLKQARDLLLSELEGISLKLGEAAPGIDFLSKHPDLQEEVNNGQITIERAQELAVQRTRSKVQADRQAADRTQEEQTQAATKERNDAIAELNTLGQTLAQSDPLYAQKHEVLKPMIAALGQMPPKQWRQAFLTAYKAVVVAAPGTDAAPANGAPSNRQGNQPLRANKSPSGGQNRQPTSLLDAVSAAIDQAG